MSCEKDPEVRRVSIQAQQLFTLSHDLLPLSNLCSSPHIEVLQAHIISSGLGPSQWRCTDFMKIISHCQCGGPLSAHAFSYLLVLLRRSWMIRQGYEAKPHFLPR